MLLQTIDPSIQPSMDSSTAFTFNHCLDIFFIFWQPHNHFLCFKLASPCFSVVSLHLKTPEYRNQSITVFIIIILHDITIHPHHCSTHCRCTGISVPLPSLGLSPLAHHHDDGSRFHGYSHQATSSIRSSSSSKKQQCPVRAKVEQQQDTEPLILLYLYASFLFEEEMLMHLSFLRSEASVLGMLNLD